MGDMGARVGYRDDEDHYGGGSGDGGVGEYDRGYDYDSRYDYGAYDELRGSPSSYNGTSSKGGGYEDDYRDREMDRFRESDYRDSDYRNPDSMDSNYRGSDYRDSYYRDSAPGVGGGYGAGGDRRYVDDLGDGVGGRERKGKKEKPMGLPPGMKLTPPGKKGAGEGEEEEGREGDEGDEWGVGEISLDNDRGGREYVGHVDVDDDDLGMNREYLGSGVGGGLDFGMSRECRGRGGGDGLDDLSHDDLEEVKDDSYHSPSIRNEAMHEQFTPQLRGGARLPKPKIESAWGN